MGLLERLFKPRTMTDDERRRAIERLDAKRRHLRGKMSRNTGEIQRAWTRFRTWRGEEDAKKKLRAEIRVLEGRRKAMVKEMLTLQAAMKKLGASSTDYD